MTAIGNETGALRRRLPLPQRRLFDEKLVPWKPGHSLALFGAVTRFQWVHFEPPVVLIKYGIGGGYDPARQDVVAYPSEADWQRCDEAGPEHSFVDRACAVRQS